MLHSVKITNELGDLLFDDVINAEDCDRAASEAFLAMRASAIAAVVTRGAWGPHGVVTIACNPCEEEAAR